jgi:RimJ/RimL family protein N-acetyltransferase
VATERHPLHEILVEAAFGRPPLANGGVTMLPALAGPRHCVIGLTAHHVIAADIDEQTVRSRLDRSDLGQPLSAAFLLFLAGWLGAEPGPIDLLMVAPRAEQADDSLELWRRADLGDHPRVRRATRYRPDVAVYGDRQTGEPDGVLVVGRGVAGRWEMAYEVAPGARGRGLGRRLASAAATLVHDGEPLFAQVAPGNAASVRACLAAGFRPIGSEVLFVPH